MSGVNGAIEWWYQFANGVSLLHSQEVRSPKAVLPSDASGCGAYWGNKWFQLQWSTVLNEAHINLRNWYLLCWQQQYEWQGVAVQARCDNSAVVAIVNWGNSQDSEVMHLIRCLAFIKAKFQFTIWATHIKGIDNDLADALSRNN